MAKDKETWITLKEAAKLTGYSPDYIGELIRKGKIPGKQVICNVAWMTTKEAILEYKEKQKERGKKKMSKKEKFFESAEEIKRRFFLHLEILKFFLKTFKLPLLIFFLIMIILANLLTFFVFSIKEKSFEKNISQTEIEKTNQPTF